TELDFEIARFTRQFSRIERCRHGILFSVTQRLQNERAISLAPKPVGTHSDKAFEPTSMFWSSIKIEFALEAFHGHAILRIKCHERFDCKPHWKATLCPYRAGVIGLADYFQRTNPLHHPGHVTEEYIARFYLPRVAGNR